VACFQITLGNLVIISASLYQHSERSVHGTGLSARPSVGRLVDRFVRKVHCGKTAEWIQMPFGMASGVGQGTSVLDGVVIIEGERAVLWVNLGRPIATSGDFVA